MGELALKDSYFKQTEAFIEGNLALRTPQRHAYKELSKSFSTDPTTHKMIVLPTGTGKTGLMGIAPFKLSDGKVLIITPSLIIREGISDVFDTRTAFNFWSDKNVILNDEHLPKVYRYAGFQKTGDKKRVLKYIQDADIIIANIHKVYNTNSRKSLVNLLSSDFFDMIIIDEAHHSAADSWLHTLEHFNASKIIKVTGTPFRSDNQEVEGNVVYEYEMADAIKDGYIKNIVAEDYTTEKLIFMVDDKEVTKEEALELMDSNWVTRSVAYSKQCSKTIVDMSIKRLLEKRQHGKAHHQIIAVACSISHAKQIMELYQAAGYSADYVTSDRPEESEKAIIKYKKGELDVLVNVNMLGEGFDHPYISVAAIFRPFRTLGPYAQFIGRALRRIPGDEIIPSIDNVAHIVYHKELGLEELWKYYTGEKEKADRRIIIQQEIERSFYERNDDIGEVKSEGNIITTNKEFLTDGIGYTYRDTIQKEITRRHTDLENQANKMREAGIPESQIEAFKQFQLREMEESVTAKRQELRAELIREELHEAHTKHILDMTEELFTSTGTEPKGTELPANSTNAMYKNLKTNDAYVAVYMNFNLKQKLKRSIDEWETYDFEEARKLIPILMGKLRKKIEGIE